MQASFLDYSARWWQSVSSPALASCRCGRQLVEVSIAKPIADRDECFPGNKVPPRADIVTNRQPGQAASKIASGSSAETT
jgi:hypothetical protein